MAHTIVSLRSRDETLRNSPQLTAAAAVVRRAQQLLHYLQQSFATARITAQLVSSSTSRVSDDATDAPHASDEAGTVVVRDEDLVAGIARFASIEKTDDLSPFQQLLLYLLDALQQRGYRRYEDYCYARIETEDGRYDTRAWYRVYSIRDFVYDVTRKEMQFQQWVNLTNGPNSVQNATRYLCESNDHQFPVLVKNRYVRAFRNGLYFSRWPLPTEPMTAGPPGTHVRRRARMTTTDGVQEIVRDRFVAYGQHEAEVSPDIVACNSYIDLDFPSEAASRPVEDWRLIETPFLQSILDFQQFSVETSDWMYVFIGRLMFCVNELDRWQVLPYLKGQASSGKSTILMNVCKNLYESVDVGVLSNNIEKKFGVSALAEKYLFIAPEIKADLQLEQAEFQSMISGESVQLNIKYKTAESVEWNVPGIMAGNQVPMWVDNAGSISRRIVLFEFARRVTDGDTELGRKLQSELPSIILKATRAYHCAIRTCGADNVWRHLPPYFHTTREDLTLHTDPLEAFMHSGKVSLHDDLYMPWNTFNTMFIAYTHEMFGRNTQIPTATQIKHQLRDRGVLYDPGQAQRVYDGIQGVKGPWLTGIDVDRADRGASSL